MQPLNVTNCYLLITPRIAYGLLIMANSNKHGTYEDLPDISELVASWLQITIGNIILSKQSILHAQTSYHSVGIYNLFLKFRGWSGGAMVLGKLPVPGCPTNLNYSRARAYCTCSRCGSGWFGHLFSYLSFLSSFSLSLGDGPI